MIIKKNILSIDYGKKNIGWAFKKSNEWQCYIYGKLKNENNVILKVWNLCKNYHIHLIVIGYPVEEGYTPTSICHDIEKFQYKLENAISSKIHIYLMNERFSTAEAKEKFFLYDGNIKKWESNKDALSAKIILERFLHQSRVNR